MQLTTQMGLGTKAQMKNETQIATKDNCGEFDLPLWMEPHIQPKSKLDDSYALQNYLNLS